MSSRATIGRLTVGPLTFPCALGRSGRTLLKREGDGATPVGTWHPTALFYRADKMLRPRTNLPCQPIRKNDGWCDDPDDRNYNHRVSHPYPTSAERLWRDDRAYNLLVTLDHNTRPRIKGAGSAIFIHIADRNFAPTQGCVALEEHVLRILLVNMDRGTKIRIST